MSLVADYGSETSSNSGSDNESSDIEEKTELNESTKQSNNANEKLPTPNFEGQSNNIVKTSVFSNPFIEAENAKKAILEKHVKMVNSKDNVNVINGKKICWNYRKGRCRFGHKCTFAHDSDLQKTDEELENDSQMQQTILYSSITNNISEPTNVDLQQIQEQNNTTVQKKKRPGLSQTLVPGKKVMKVYEKQKLKNAVQINR